MERGAKQWGSTLLVAISAFYFGWLQGKKEEAIAPGEITIEGKKILIPRNVYDTVKSLIEGKT